MKELQCESWADNLGVYLFDENGSIEAIQDEKTLTTYYPIPIRSLFIGDKTHGGLKPRQQRNMGVFAELFG